MGNYEQPYSSCNHYEVRHGNISEIIRDLKKHTSKEITKEIQAIPESRKEWLLNAMSKEAKRIGGQLIVSYGRMTTMP